VATKGPCADHGKEVQAYHTVVSGLAAPGRARQGSGMGLVEEIQACRLCAAQFAQTATAHRPRPVVWFRPAAPRPPRLLIAGQAPGARVHDSGRPFSDRSGDRLRDWMGLSDADFYDLDRVAIVPMAFCFPGYDTKGSDLPPPPVCAATWRARVLPALGLVPLTLLVGSAAMRWHLGARDVTATVAGWREPAARGVFPLPHPSWRNTGWLKRNPWFETDLLPALRIKVRQVMDD
jgi:uracil-DNA glycosylase